MNVLNATELYTSKFYYAINRNKEKLQDQIQIVKGIHEGWCWSRLIIGL